MTTPQDEDATPQDEDATPHDEDATGEDDDATPAAASSAAGTDVADVFRRALRYLLVLLTVLAVGGPVVGWLVAGWPGVWAAAIAVGLTLIFSGTTVVSMLRTAHVHPSTMGVVVMAAWVGKMMVVLIALAALHGLDFYDRRVLGVVLIIGVIGSAVVDYRAVVGSRVPYLQPPYPADGDRGASGGVG